MDVQQDNLPDESNKSFSSESSEPSVDASVEPDESCVEPHVSVEYLVEYLIVRQKEIPLYPARWDHDETARQLLIQLFAAYAKTAGGSEKKEMDDLYKIFDERDTTIRNLLGYLRKLKTNATENQISEHFYLKNKWSAKAERGLLDRCRDAIEEGTSIHRVIVFGKTPNA